jgi:hypothetical protein
MTSRTLTYPRRLLVSIRTEAAARRSWDAGRVPLSGPPSG